MMKAQSPHEPILHDVRVSVQTQYMVTRSNPGRGLHFYAYTITITNAGNVPCQLLSRHWIITDGAGREEEVRGPGVVGQQPRLAPGESFSYTSGCPLQTTMGSMRGSYQMRDALGNEFEATIEPFALSQSELLN